ncbi:DUF1801 domain-containing protein [Myxococcota bacterium]|nr:DUF1801 domain-containing protein [Myxococcota bacterium]
MTTVEQYINSFAPATRALLRELRATIISAAPNATERINYQLPTYSLNGDLVHFGAFTRHIGFYPSPGAITAFANELSGYKTSKGAVQFPLNRPLPLELVEKMVRFRVKENTEKTKRK